MGKSRNLSKLLVDSSGDVEAGSLDNVPPSDDASALTTGTLAVARLPNEGLSLGSRNRIINGDMRIDQRNAGASVTPAATNTYYLDRWQLFGSQTNKFNVGQNLGLVTPPAGFDKYLGLSVASSVSVGASDYFLVGQQIEGNNISDLGFGSSNAKTVTISFWVRSSLTGTFGAVLENNIQNRAYPFTYTISVADTWEYKTVTIPGDTIGTWLTNNGTGFFVLFSLGVGSNFNGTAGAWAGSQTLGVTGAVSVIGTLNATWYVTGVQLEVGSVATPFERRPYGTELSLCQRYFQSSIADRNATVTTNAIGIQGTRHQFADVMGYRSQWFSYKTVMRTNPTVTLFNADNSGASGQFRLYSHTGDTQNFAGFLGNPGADGFFLAGYTGVSVGTSGLSVVAFFHYTASAEL